MEFFLITATGAFVATMAEGLFTSQEKGTRAGIGSMLATALLGLAALVSFLAEHIRWV